MQTKKIHSDARRLNQMTRNFEPAIQLVNNILDKYDVLQLLKISPRTLSTYIKEGYLERYVIKGKTFFLYSDILKMLERFREVR
ncbi:helix-turn-helix domain-containing protein [Pedobacter xixiisoli]|uniref:Helix-turn-helix domain-containing protein n=1 Tax=Pedobacter xixiisoli TaxID=1476464 RepID=A0A285ZXG5_9SPHI|nr:helix-turn-helix domain-containing protein [Pedobacter xixiisoli]SOD14336.1 hypothetical protein SAMN06297358_1523 [Pedobacter xixiisoli]